MTLITRITRVLLLALVTAGLGLVLIAQKPSDVIRWTAAAPESPVKPGGTATVRVSADIDPGWHLYAFDQPRGGPRSLEVTAAKDAPFAIVTAKIDAPPPKIQHDPNFNLDTRYYDDRTTIAVPVRVAVDAASGTRTTSFEITFQACTERLCLRPFTETVAVALTIASEAQRK